MKPVQFLSNSVQIENIIKGLTLSKSLFVSTILIGEPNSGKKTLVKSLFSKQRFIDGRNQEELTRALDNFREVIIYNFDKIENIESLNFENKRVIAIANGVKNSPLIERKFAFIYYMPPLRERMEDIDMLVSYFIKDIRKDLMIDDTPILFNSKDIDLSQNIKSLRASIYKKLILNSLTDGDIEQILYEYLYRNMEGNNAYRENLPLFERPLIEAGLKKFKSQLKLSSVLGLNRNTLRKKIYELGID
jgi:DNA-binding protein Fis